jgi:hypothetical protein
LHRGSRVAAVVHFSGRYLIRWGPRNIDAFFFAQSQAQGGAPTGDDDDVPELEENFDEAARQ